MFCGAASPSSAPQGLGEIESFHGHRLGRAAQGAEAATDARGVVLQEHGHRAVRIVTVPFHGGLPLFRRHLHLLDGNERQALLGAETAESRLELVRTLLRRETSLIQHFGALPAIDLLTDNFSPN